MGDTALAQVARRDCAVLPSGRWSEASVYNSGHPALGGTAGAGVGADQVDRAVSSNLYHSMILYDI